MSTATTRKVYVAAFGGPEEVSIITAEVPAPSPGHVQVKTICSGMGGADIAMRLGSYPLQRSAPLTLGYSLVGRVLHNGPGCSKFEPGTLVACLTVYDAHAELVNLPEKYLIPVPEGVDPKHAVAIVLDWTTAYGLVYRSGKVTKGMRVFIHGMSGAVGNAILHLCKLEGAEIYGTASKANHAALRELGTTPFVYSDKNWIAAMNAIGGAHVIFDPLGYESFDESWSIKAPEGGHLVGYGGNFNLLNGGKPRSQIPSMTKLMARNLCLTHKASFFWISRDQSTFEPELRTLFEMCRQGKIEVPIKKEWTLDEYPEAHRMWNTPYGCGSVVINIGDEKV